MANLAPASKLKRGDSILHNHVVVKVRTVITGFGETLVNYTDSQYPIALRADEMVTVYR